MGKALEIKLEIEQVIDLLIDASSLIDSNEVVMHEYERRCFGVSWTSTPHLGYLFCDVPSIAHYLEIIRRRDFTALFRDGALLQLAYEIEHDDVVRHRLAYVPCPFSFTAGELAAFGGIADILEAFGPRDFVERSHMLSPIRFDFDIRHSDTIHTHSHLTIGKTSCRVPVYGPVSVGHFIRFLGTHFHPGEIPLDEELRARFWSRTLPLVHEHEFFIDTCIR